jgi:CheY-like chemotaxis protein
MEYDFIGKTILVVEDEDFSRIFFEKSLKKTNANLLFAKDGIEAIEIVMKNDNIDLVLMDIRLPRMDGIEATSRIKHINPEIPVIVQTAYAMDSALFEARNSGCDGFITKPIDIRALLLILQEHLYLNLLEDKMHL